LGLIGFIGYTWRKQQQVGYEKFYSKPFDHVVHPMVYDKKQVQGEKYV
jgi:hypothetical protein